jgi:cellulose synthase/poly-beta-1,6-N-acetylglucosamine synthase-like glycosyltransferase
MSLIITAHNEAHQIEDKIKNSLALEYPPKLIEIIVASDGSTDTTDDIVRSFEGKGVRLIPVKDRKGKENAQLHAIQAAAGDVLVFSDVATIIPNDSLMKLSAYFADPSIGGVSSEDRIIGEGGNVEGEGAYVRYEMWIRRLESELFGLVGLSGSFFACRKEIARKWDISVPSDFNTALNCVLQGRMAVTAPDVIGYYRNIRSTGKEYLRKYRTGLRGIAAIAAKPEVLNPFKVGFYSFEVWSHKIMRWLVPYFLLLLFFINVYLLNDGLIYEIIFVGQILFYGLAILGAFSQTSRNIPVVKIVYYFVQVNIALGHAIFDFVRGKRITMWSPSRR